MNLDELIICNGGNTKHLFDKLWTDGGDKFIEYFEIKGATDITDFRLGFDSVNAVVVMDNGSHWVMHFTIDQVDTFLEMLDG